MKNSVKALYAAASALALTLSVPAFAHPHEVIAEPAIDAAEQAAENTGPALWKVADEDTTIYLFGTVHVLPEDVEWYTARIATALGSSDELVTEIYLAPGTEAEASAAFMREGTLPEGTTLRDLLSEDDRANFEAALVKLGYPKASFDAYEPWLAAVNLSMLPLLKAGYNPAAGVEKVLEEKAVNMPRGKLETIDFQVGIFDGLPMESQIKFMMEAANGIDDIVPSLNTMVAEWVEGDPDGLAELLNEGLSDVTLAEAILYSRNRTWAEWIDTRLDTPGTIFVAVGAGHLAGKGSVQSALETRGIETTRVQ